MSEQARSAGGGCLLLALVLALTPVLVAVLIMAMVAGGHAGPCGPGGGGGGGGQLPPEARVDGYGRDRLQNAVVIANVAGRLGLGQRGQYLGIVAAIGESTLDNLDHGDEGQGVTNPDGSATCSVGLFQQQWCLEGEPWGNREDAMNPETAATNFFNALTRESDWQTGTPTLVINAVQGNQDPMHYARYEADAQKVLDYIAPYLAGGAGGSGRCLGASNGVLALPLDPGFIMTDTYGPRIAPVDGASSWHPAYDLVVPGQGCGPPVYSMSSGTVESAENSWLNVRTDTGELIGYLHSPAGSYTVQPGDRVQPGQKIAEIGNEGYSSGCHLDIRISKEGSTDPNVLALVGRDRYGAAGPYVNPSLYFQLYGMVLCDEACLNGYSLGVDAQ